MLTERQQEIWQYLVEYVDGHGYPPTVREIGDAVGLASPSTVHAHLANLERAGLLKRDPTKPRALELVGRRRTESAQAPDRSAPVLPLVGRIAAGGPLLAEEAVEDEIAVPEPLGRNADFLLRVKGDSMIEAGILDGDLVVVRKQQDARNGDIVVALVGDDETADEATVKTFHRERDGRIRLQPENSGSRAALPRARRDPRQGHGRVPDAVMSVSPLNRTLDQELSALVRGASLECLVCGEFVLRVRSAPQRRAGLPRVLLDPRDGARRSRHCIFRLASYHPPCRPGDRGLLFLTSRRAARGKSGHRRAGRWEAPKATSWPTQAAKADGKWNRKETAGRGKPTPVRVKRWGKSPPAVVATRPASQTPSGARRSRFR